MKKLLVVAFVVALLPVALLLLLLVATPSDSCPLDERSGRGVTLDPQQSAHARTVVDVGQRMRVPTAGMVIAIAAALQESGLRNLAYGDRDSLGLFQQRPSQGWGSPAQLLDPRYAATRFYTALLSVPDWQRLPAAAAAQAVQRSAFPAAYARWTGDASRIVAAASASTAPGCAAAGVPGAAPTRVIEFAAAQVGDAYVLGANGPDVWDCSSLVQAAFASAGVRVPRTAAAQYDYLRARGRLAAGPPRLTQLRPGDLLFSRGARPNTAADGQPIGHVALYAGDGLVIEAKGSRWGVTSRSYSDAALAAITWIGRLPTPTAVQAHTTTFEWSSP